MRQDEHRPALGWLGWALAEEEFFWNTGSAFQFETPPAIGWGLH